MYDCRYMLQRLNKVWLQGIFQQCTHCTFCMKIACRYRFLLCYLAICISDYHLCKTVFQICDVICQAQNCHDLGCNRDIVAILSRHSVCLSAKSVYDKTQLTVIHIHTSSPSDLSRIDVQLIALVDMVVDHCCKQVVCCADRMEVTGEVKVDILHRHNLCVSAACSSALYTEDRSKGRLTKCYHCLLAKLLHTVRKAYGRRSLSFSCRSRIDCRYKDQLTILFIGLS